MSKYSSLELPNGAKMPMVGLGTWKSKPGEVENAVRTALDLGYRHIDCAYIYGNESEVGEGLKEKLNSGVLKREDVFVVSKLWNSRHSPNDVKPSCMESLKNLGVDYLDLYLIHWPMAFQPGKENFPRDAEGNVLYADTTPLQTWKAVEKLVEEGLVKAIGLSNFNSLQIQEIWDNSKIKPAVLQVEIHPYFQNEKLVKFCQEKGMIVTAYSPFGSPDRPWATPEEPTLLDDPRLLTVANQHKKTPAQIILQWLLQRNIVVIPKSVTPARIKENFEVADFELTADDMEVMKSFDTNTRIVVPYAEKDGKRVYRDRAAPYFPFLADF